MIVRQVLDWSIGFASTDEIIEEHLTALTRALAPTETPPDVVYRTSRRDDGTILLARDDWEWWLEPQYVFPTIMADLVDQLRDRNDVLLLHAATLARAGRAIVLPGMSGRGKSSTAVALAARGFDIMSDELALLEPDGTVVASTLPLRVRESSLPLVRAQQSLSVTGPRFFAKGEWTYPVLPADPGPDRAQIAMLCFLQPRRPGEPANAEPSSPAQATFDLLAESINRAAPTPDTFALASRVCGRVPAWVVSPGGIEQTADLIREIWDNLDDDR